MKINFKIKLTTATLALAATLCGGSAQALSVDWGVHPAAVARAVTPDVGSFFDDVFSFSIASAGSVGGAVVANNLNAGQGEVYLVIGGVFGLYSNPDGVVGNGDDAAVGPGLRSFDGLSGDLSTVNALDAGRYYYRVLGLAAGSAGAAYLITSSFVTAVPEMATPALLLAGLGGVGLALRRRARPGSMGG